VRTEQFDFELPERLIAQHPVEPRDESRLLVVDRASATWTHRRFLDLPGILRPGDLIVRNNTRVVPARLIGRRVATNGRWEGLFLRALPENRWEVLSKTRGRIQPGEQVEVQDGLRLVLESRLDGGRWIAAPEMDGSPIELLERFGAIPLPPYIRRGRESPEDRLRYQTLYAQSPGAVAAPTAGLHFTERVFQRLADRGMAVADVTLHVGIGTFRPIEAEEIDQHVLHAEWAELSPESAMAIESARIAGGRIVAVGTTTARTLETAARSGRVQPFSGETALYLKPGHRFQGFDILLTNFHLPRSSLLVLVAAFAGYDLMRDAYRDAIDNDYRFYSYGDAMLIL
jgi:S-adenosylmethionine:tRNA ribosyltransferase-isomerase